MVCRACGVELPGGQADTVAKHVGGKQHRKAAASAPAGHGTPAWLPGAEAARIIAAAEAARRAKAASSSAAGGEAASVDDITTPARHHHTASSGAATGKKAGSAAASAAALFGKAVVTVGDQSGAISAGRFAAGSEWVSAPRGGGGSGGGGGTSGGVTSGAKEGPHALSNLMSSHAWGIGGRNALAGLHVWVKFITGSQDSAVVHGADALLEDARRHNLRPGSWEEAHGSAGGHLHLGVHYSFEAGGVETGKGAALMPPKLREIGKHVALAAGPVGAEDPSLPLDCGTLVVLERGMHLPPHAFDAARTCTAPTYILVCGGDAEFVFGYDLASAGGEEGKWTGGSPPISVPRRALVALMPPARGSGLQLAVPTVAHRVVLFILHAVPRELRATLIANTTVVA